MAHVAVVGGGPAGLSAALFTAKNGLETTLLDAGETWLHRAHLFNYPGIDSRDGTAFVADLGEQVRSFGADLYTETTVTHVEKDGSEFHLTAAGGLLAADYLVLATGTDRSLASALGCAFTSNPSVVAVDLSMETSVRDAYATGAMVRASEWQAVIAAGDGAAAALSILSKERGAGFHDFDVPADAE
jgi:thioredoxin reductase